MEVSLCHPVTHVCQVEFLHDEASMTLTPEAQNTSHVSPSYSGRSQRQGSMADERQVHPRARRSSSPRQLESPYGWARTRRESSLVSSLLVPIKTVCMPLLRRHIWACQQESIVLARILNLSILKTAQLIKGVKNNFGFREAVVRKVDRDLHLAGSSIQLQRKWK